MTRTPLLHVPGEGVGSRRLIAWALLQGALGVAALVAASRIFPLHPDIGLPIPGADTSASVLAGTAAWVAFGLLGGTRVRARPGGSVMTFSMPFIVAGTLLGGPFAGGLMGLLSEWELRELRVTPWYGTVANHGVAILTAVLAGAIAFGAKPILAALLPGQANLAFALTAAVAAFAFSTLNVAFVVPTLAIREGIGLLEASRSYDASFRATSVAEGVLAWLMAATYLLIGWWAPVVCVVLVLAVWQSYDRLEDLLHDPMTGLLNDAGFMPRLVAIHAAARSHGHAYALLILDLDRFKAANDAHGETVGDEVIRAVARRIYQTVRVTDVVARLHRAGDEFAVVLVGVADTALAVTLARRIQDAVRRPIHIRGMDVVVEVGATIGLAMGEPGTAFAASDVRASADRRMHRAKEHERGSIRSDDRGSEAAPARAGMAVDGPLGATD